VFLGDARAEKGVDVLAASLGLLSTELSNRHVEFVIQCYISPVDRQLTETVVQVLMKSVQSIDRGIELVENHLDTKTYYQLLNEADAIIMPYRRVFYRARTSGILAEAIAAGKPVIVPRETWMSQQARDYGACVEFEDGNPADLARAIRKLIETHHALREQAERRSLHWREMHTADNLLDIMISHWSRSLNHVQS
jgi:glycosyltransferase involved in cell wall biosynthesis